jgi:YgiT-type zinc finger domain-containing protein
VTEDQVPESSDYAISCPECRSGVMHLQYLTYFTWLKEDLVTVPNFPAWVCDMCGRRDYDDRAITWLNTLLNPMAGRRRSSAHRSRSSRADRLHP